jgi:hypothetical protein
MSETPTRPVDPEVFAAHQGVYDRIAAGEPLDVTAELDRLPAAGTDQPIGYQLTDAALTVPPAGWTVPLEDAPPAAGPPWVPTLDVARDAARKALARAEREGEDPRTGYAALVGDLEVTLRLLADALDVALPRHASGDGPAPSVLLAAQIRAATRVTRGAVERADALDVGTASPTDVVRALGFLQGTTRGLLDLMQEGPK